MSMFRLGCTSPTFFGLRLGDISILYLGLQQLIYKNVFIRTVGNEFPYRFVVSHNYYTTQVVEMFEYNGQTIMLRRNIPRAV